MVNRVVPRDELDDATLALAQEIAKNEPFVIQMTKRALNRAWDVAGFRAAMAANTELDVMIETSNLPARDEFRRITGEQGLKAAIAWRDARFRGERSVTRWNLQPLLAPRSIAIVGASESPDSWAPEIERSLRHFGFDGELYPINPKYDTVWGRPCLASIARAAARRGSRRVRRAGAGGRADDRRLRRSRGARDHGRVVAGSPRPATRVGRCRPSFARRRCATRSPCSVRTSRGSSTMLTKWRRTGRRRPPTPMKGGISVISQSGTVAWTMNQMASDRAVGLRIILGVGNEAVLGLGDLFAWAAADPKTTVVTSYIETMRDVEGIGRGPRRVARRAEAGR